ncbi:Uncharacterized membrane protein [Roseivivax lentus]|uniref:Uncharacterized membrane protein n=1 Tax=Roseivivax lentus TaxID=633194 RepID=A0A1N7NV64_9RHOB|nr:NnrU family protein [Roseivivax lentus]SIT02207.1 Uncharacterized membrane protein [Roseivivax lentus]
MGWIEFIAAFATFFLSHALPVRPAVKRWLQARLGATGFTVLYSLVSLAALSWVIAAAGRAPVVPLWSRAPWQTHVVLALMLPVCLILALAIAGPNPFSFGGAHNARFDPARPGIVRVSRHPLLLALALWAAAHLVPNGDLAHVILFATFAGFAALGGRLIDRRKAWEMGPDWQRMRARVAQAPMVPRPLSRGSAAARLALGVALYATLLWLHPWLFGVDPLA